MGRIFRLIFACLALGSASTAHAVQASDMAPCAPNEPQELRTLTGFLIAHVACNRVLLEIPVQMLDRSILAYTGSPLCRPGHRVRPRFGHRQPRGALDPVRQQGRASERQVRQLGRGLCRFAAGDRRDLAAHRHRRVRRGERGRRRGAHHRHHLFVHDQRAKRLRARFHAALSHGAGGWPALPYPQRPCISEQRRNRLLPDLGPGREGPAQAIRR